MMEGDIVLLIYEAPFSTGHQGKHEVSKFVADS